MLNHITIMGRLTRDPELRKTGTGVSVASFTIACDRDFADKQTNQKETDFFDIVAWKNTADFVSKFFTKGRMAVVSGRLQIRSWNDKDGNKRKTAEIIADSVYFGDSKSEADTQDRPYMGGGRKANDFEMGQMGGFEELTGTDEGLPF